MYWARDKVLAAADGLSEEEYGRENGFTYKSIRGILTHTLGGEEVWLSRPRLETPGPFISEDEVPDLESLRQRWTVAEQKQRAYLAELTDAGVAADVSFKGRDGAEQSMPAWQILTLVFHHTVQHRSEAAEALTMIGRSPGGVDLMFYTRERSPA